MSRYRYAIALAVLLAVAGALALTGQMRPVLVFLGLAPKHKSEQVYWCPMHPFYKVKRYGICPYCNMALEPYTAGMDTGDSESMLVLTPQQIQQAGVRTEKVSRRELVNEIETTGIADINHERYWHIEFRTEGWIEELFVHVVGERVEVGAPIARVYSPTLFASQKEYLLAVQSKDALMVESTRKRLELMGVDPEEIEALVKRNEPSARLLLRSKVAGTLVHINVKAGMKIPEDGHIADVADLSELWVWADVYDRERTYARVGQEIRVLAGTQTYTGRIDLLEPRVRAATQTARVRMRVPNEPQTLSPGQFVRVLLLTRIPDALSVSENAVIPTGRRDLVILALGGGRFTAREVTVGRRWLTGTGSPDSHTLEFFTGHNRFHEVLDGLREGDEVVTSGAFLLHAETQIRNLIDKMVPEREKRDFLARSAWSGRRLRVIHEVDGIPFADHAESQAYQAAPQKSWKEAEPQILAGVRNWFEKYVLYHEAILAKNLKLAEEYGESLAAAGADLKSKLTDPLAKEIREPIEALVHAAQGAPTATEFVAIMKRFGILSAALEKYLAEFENPIDRTLYQFYCGMAQQRVGSPTERWFQLDGHLRNPFDMPSCGSMEKEIHPPKKEAPKPKADARLFAPYFDLHDAVVKKDAARAAKAAADLAALDAGFKPVADAIAAAKDPKEIEKQFGVASARIEALVEAGGNPTGKPLYKFYCGMAKRTRGSPTEAWFQPDDQLRNPFGMPGCGSLEKTIP